MGTGRPRPVFRLIPALTFVILLVAALAPALRADGIVLPPVAAPPVTMPDQRALLVWHEKEQTETLVIESRFTGSGHDFAWIVPLPSKPEIAPATRGTLPTLAALFRPEIATEWTFAPVLAVGLGFLMFLMFAHGTEGIRPLARISAVAIGCVGVVALGLGAIYISENSWLLCVAGLSFLIFARLLWLSAKRVWLAPLGVLFGCGLIIGVIMPTVGSVRGISGEPVPAGVDIERSIVGDYDVAVLSGTSGNGIAQWLRDNRFALPPAAETIVAEHTRADGYFVAARLQRTADDPNPTAPAPLVFTFKTPQPIYPMKLTGAGMTRPLDVELFVFGNARATADGLVAQACAPVEFSTGINVQTWQPRSADTIQLSHPALRKLCADTQIATRLKGTFSPGQTPRDLTIHWKSFGGTMGLLKYAPGDALGRAFLVAATILFCCAIGFAWHRGSYQVPLCPALFAVLAAGLVTVGVWLSLPTIPVVQGKSPRIARWEMRELAKRCFIEFMDLKPEESTELRVHEITQQVLKEHHFSESHPNLREGDAPGNYQLQRLSDGFWRFTWIDDYGREIFFGE